MNSTLDHFSALDNEVGKKLTRKHSIQDIQEEQLRLIVTRAVDAGLLDPVTFAPLMSLANVTQSIDCKLPAWNRVKIKKHQFEMPQSMSNPQFLAAGGYGCVVECWYNGQKVAVKKVAVPTKRNTDDMLRLVREVVILQKVRRDNFPSLTPLLDVYSNTDCTAPNKLKHLYIVMPLCQPGCLEEVEVNSPEMFRSIATQTLEGLYWLHAHGILHRDLKRENIFYDKERNQAVLGDMGSARLKINKKMTGKDEVGTKCYLAPEFMAGQVYSYTSDVWALAVCWYEMLCVEDGQDTMFPLNDIKDLDRLAMQRAFCHLINPSLYKTKPRSTAANIEWAQMTWARVAEMEQKWDEPAYRRIFRNTFIFDQAQRPLTEKLFEDPFFAGRIPNVNVGPVEGLEIEDYDTARSFLFSTRTMCAPVPHEPSCGKVSVTGVSTICPSDSVSCVDTDTQFSLNDSPWTPMRPVIRLYDSDKQSEISREVQMDNSYLGILSDKQVTGKKPLIRNPSDTSTVASTPAPLGRRQLVPIDESRDNVLKKKRLLVNTPVPSPKKKSPRQ